MPDVLNVFINDKKKCFVRNYFNGKKNRIFNSIIQGIKKHDFTCFLICKKYLHNMIFIIIIT